MARSAVVFLLAFSSVGRLARSTAGAGSRTLQRDALRLASTALVAGVEQRWQRRSVPDPPFKPSFPRPIVRSAAVTEDGKTGATDEETKRDRRLCPRLHPTPRN